MRSGNNRRDRAVIRRSNKKYDTIKAAVSSMLSSFGEVIPQFLTVVQVLIEAIIGILPDVLTTLVTSIIGWVPSLLETVLQVLQSLILAITGNVQMRYCKY